MLSCSKLITFLNEGLTKLNIQSAGNNLQVQTTSFDGRPLLTPSQFHHLFLQDFPHQDNQSELKDPRDQDSSRHSTNKHKKSKKTSRSDPSVKEIDYLSQRREILRQDSDLDKLENIEKRVKSEDSLSDPSTDYENLSETDVLSSSPSVVDQAPAEEQLIDQQQETRDLPSDEKVVKAVFDYESEQVMFHIQTAGEDSGTNSSTKLARDEVLEKDPRLLLYFYESHLQFAKQGEFNPSKLKKV